MKGMYIQNYYRFYVHLRVGKSYILLTSKLPMVMHFALVLQNSECKEIIFMFLAMIVTKQVLN